MRNKEIELKEPETKSQSEARMMFKTPIRKQEMVKNKGSTQAQGRDIKSNTKTWLKVHNNIEYYKRH